MITIAIEHDIEDLDTLRERLVALTQDASITQHLSHLERHPTGLVWRFRGESIAEGQLFATPADRHARVPGTAALQLRLKGLAVLVEGKIGAEIRAVAERHFATTPDAA